LQPFVNYNLSNGWYSVSSPVITADWNQSPSDRWTVPVGGAAGRIFKIGGQPINAQVQAFDYVEKPAGGPQWAIRFQLQFLFPR
jgi:hypothetical protein